MDTPATESAANTAELDVNSAAVELAKLIDPQPEVKEPEEKAPPEEKAEAPAEEEGAELPAELEIEVDGKTVKLTKEQIADAYKSGLRQSDYTKKTMEVAEQRKAAEAEITKAREERAAYAQKLAEQEAVLKSAIQERVNSDWQKLLESDPVEYLRQQHLLGQGHAALAQIQQEREQVTKQQQAEQANNLKAFVARQQEELLAKLPEWKDGEKAQAEKDAIRKHLNEVGFDSKEIDSIVDHRAILLARKAMLYDQMIAKASAAAKKVSTAPVRVERPSGGEAPSLDKRSAAFQRLSKSGSIDDAAAVFASIL